MFNTYDEIFHEVYQFINGCFLYGLVHVCVGIQVTRINGRAKSCKAIANKKENDKKIKIKKQMTHERKNAQKYLDEDI